MKKVFRPAARLVIIKNKKILLCKMWDIWWLPWGGIDWWECIETALKRESMEELAIAAEFDKVLFIQDFTVELLDLETHNHSLEYFCTVKNNEDFFNVVDIYETASHAYELRDLAWFWIDEIPHTMKPQSFIQVLTSYLENPDSVQWVYHSWIN